MVEENNRVKMRRKQREKVPGAGCFGVRSFKKRETTAFVSSSFGSISRCSCQYRNKTSFWILYQISTETEHKSNFWIWTDVALNAYIIKNPYIEYFHQKKTLKNSFLVEDFAFQLERPILILHPTLENMAEGGQNHQNHIVMWGKKKSQKTLK